MNEKLMAVEAIISNYISGQFASNGVSIEEGILILKSVCFNLTNQYVNQSIMSRIQFVNPEQPKTMEKTGTPEELKKDLKRTGFKMVNNNA